MFAIVPDSSEFTFDDAEYFNDYELANDSAFDWSVSLNGCGVKIFEEKDVCEWVGIKIVFA